MSLKCFETCEVLKSWISNAATADSRSDCNFADDIGAIMSRAAQTALSLALEVDFIPLRSEAVTTENNRLTKGYVGSLFDECSVRNLDGFTVLVACIQAGLAKEDCKAQCPFIILHTVSDGKV